LNSARAKLGTAANLHYVHSGRQGTPTLLSRHQITYLCKKKKSCAWKGPANEAAEDGPIDDIYIVLCFCECPKHYHAGLFCHAYHGGLLTMISAEPMVKKNTSNYTIVRVLIGCVSIYIFLQSLLL
jgi:hypothetical protein